MTKVDFTWSRISGVRLDSSAEPKFWNSIQETSEPLSLASAEMFAAGQLESNASDDRRSVSGVIRIRGNWAITDIPPSKDAPASGDPGLMPPSTTPPSLNALPLQSHQVI